MSIDKRRNPRIDLHFQVKIKTKHKGLHEVRDLSVSGLFIKAKNSSRFGEGDEIELVMQLPIEDSLMRLNARVARVTEKGIGVEFLNLTHEDHKALEYCFNLASLTSPLPHLIDKREKASAGFEKRRNPRVDLNLQVSIRTKHEGPHTVQDLSVGGLFIQTANPSQFQAEDEIELTMQEPADNKTMRLNARVARVAEDGIGVEFLNLTPEDYSALELCFDLFRHTLPMMEGG